ALRLSPHFISFPTRRSSDLVVTDTIVTAPNSAPKATLFLLAGLTALSEFAVTAYIPAITIIADGLDVRTEIVQTTVSVGLVTGRSEERRVGKGWRMRRVQCA